MKRLFASKGPITVGQMALNIICLVLPLWFCVIMIMAGFTPSINGFGVDRQGNLYVGEGKMVRVYRDGQQIGSIGLRSSQYALTINDADELIVAYTTQTVRMDTAGNILETASDPSSSYYQHIFWHNQKFTAADGEVYSLRHVLGWTQIVKNGTQVEYRLNPLSFLVKCVLIADVTLMIVTIPLLVIRGRKYLGVHGEKDQ